MHTNSPPPAREILGDPDLTQIVMFAKRHLKLIVALGGIAAACAAAVAYSIPPQWQASTVVQIGQFTRDRDVTPLEPLAKTVERMQQPEFRKKVLERLGLPAQKQQSRETALIDATLTVRARDPHLISIETQGYSVTDARRYVAAYRDLLIEEHKTALQNTLDRMKSERATTEQGLAAIERQRSQINASFQDRLQKGSSVAQSDILLVSVLHEYGEESARLTDRLNRINFNLDPLNTFNSRGLSDVVASMDSPVYPRKTKFVALGLFAGIAAGIGIGLLLELLRKSSTWK